MIYYYQKGPNIILGIICTNLMVFGQKGWTVDNDQKWSIGAPQKN